MAAISRILILLIMNLLLQSSVWAQEKPQPFENIQLQLSYQQNINFNTFHEYWDADPAFQLDVVTPFYAGDFFIGGRYVNYSNLDNDLPDINFTQLNVGWGYRHEIFKRTQVGGRAGVLFNMMKFDNVTDEHQERAEKRFGSRSPESEIGFLLGAEIRYQILENWAIRFMWNRSIIYTRHKIKLDFVGVGISRSFETPRWLREILK